MNKKLFVFMILSILFGLSFVSANIDCVWETNNVDNSCSAGYDPVFNANRYFNDSSGRVLSSNVRLNNQTYDSNYNRILCCRSDVGTIDFSTTNSGSSCGTRGQELLYFTSQTNARIGYNHFSSFNPAFYTDKLCVNLSEEYSQLDLRILDNPGDEIRYAAIGYKCLYRTNDVVNGHVSDCEATFNGGNKYNYSIYGRLWENFNTLSCNYDCTSRLDNRVYSWCAEKVPDCSPFKNELVACHGSLYQGWVGYDTNGDSIIDSEFECSAPWNNYRSLVFTNERLNVQSSNECSNLLDLEYQVLIDNELVKMHVYVCED